MSSLKIPFYKLVNQDHFFERLVSPNANSQWKIGTDTYIELSLYISPKGIIDGLYVQENGLKHFLPYLKLISDLVVGKSYEFAKQITWNELLDHIEFDNDRKSVPFFALPIQLLRMAIDDYLGQTSDYCSLKNQKLSQVVCFCFGVFQNQLLKICSTYPDIKSERDLSRYTLAGSGCGGCTSDLSKIISTKQLSEYDQFFFQDMSLLDWAVKLDDYFKEHQIQAKPLGIENGKIKIESADPNILDFIRRHFGSELLGALSFV